MVDAGGGTILPGVIDAHVHTGWDFIHGIDRLTPWLQYGITTLGDQGTAKNATLLHRAAIDAIPGAPRVQLAGPVVTAPGGYPVPAWYYWGAHEVAGEPAARNLVIDLIENQGVDTIKIAIERGFLSDYSAASPPAWPTFTEAEVAAITDEAHARGKIVGAHLTGPEELEVAYENGVDVAVHTPITPIPPAIVAAAVAADMTFISTAKVWKSVPFEIANLSAIRTAGGRVAVGTDAPHEPPGMMLREFEALAIAGFSNMEIIQAATHNGAVAIGRESDLGTLEAGKLGDVIVVDGDPLADYHVLADVESVILAGEIMRSPYSGPDDGDGIAANVDAQHCCHTGDYSDVKLGGTSFGTIVARNGLSITVTDEPQPAGLRITASGVGGPAVLGLCSRPIVMVPIYAGQEIISTCHSAAIEVVSGPVVAEFDSLFAQLPTGTNVTVENELARQYDVTNDASASASAVIGGVTIAPGATVNGITDTDEDGLADSVETDTGVYVSPGDTGTDPAEPDYDGDGVGDGDEVFLHDTDPTITDTDGDGCGDGTELGALPVLGGDRDPADAWDFFDVTGDQLVDFSDTIAVLTYFGDAAPPGSPADLLDRDVLDPAKPWRTSASNTGVDFTDALNSLSSFGHSCS
jgi:imidazolonepropionase-like amidohydrolase